VYFGLSADFDYPPQFSPPLPRIIESLLYIGEIGWDGMGWIGLVLDKDRWKALVNAVMNLQVPENAGKFLSGCTTIAP
jgi:hypothetical protein